jgi:hypothetical protein
MSPVNKAIFGVATLGLSLGVGADSPTNLSPTACIGLDDAGMKRCMEIIARHQFGALPNFPQLTLAEKTAIDAIMAADPKAILIVFPGGQFAIGQPVTSRAFAVPCKSNPCGASQ